MKRAQAERLRKLENLFFYEKDRDLMDRMNDLRQMESTRQTLSEVSGITVDSVLDKLLELEITPKVLAMMTLVPLVEVAWADRHVHENEKAAILAAAAEKGFAKETIDYRLLEEWLTRRPSPRLMEAWEHSVAGLCEDLTDAQREELKDKSLARARKVAEAAGGFIGLASPISPGEKRILDRMEKAFGKTK